MAKSIFVQEFRNPDPYVFTDEELKKWNENIVETAGFIPLEVRFKQMEQAGYRARFFESEFTSKDVSDMYLNHPEFDITPEDDMEEAMQKILMRQEYIKQVKEDVKRRNAAIEAQKAEEAERNASKKNKPVESEEAE